MKTFKVLASSEWTHLLRVSKPANFFVNKSVKAEVRLAHNSEVVATMSTGAGDGTVVINEDQNTVLLRLFGDMTKAFAEKTYRFDVFVYNNLDRYWRSIFSGALEVTLPITDTDVEPAPGVTAPVVIEGLTGTLTWSQSVYSDGSKRVYIGFEDFTSDAPIDLEFGTIFDMIPTIPGMNAAITIEDLSEENIVIPICDTEVNGQIILDGK